jgi:putative aminopeptidase FrvX
METQPLQFLESLTNAFGPSGFEREALKVVHDYVIPFCKSITQDKIGSLLFEAEGDRDTPVILMPGHVDEVGFLITGVNDKGFLPFTTLGGWFDQVLLGQRVIVRTRQGDREGIIASKPPHILSPEERNKVVTKDKMFIDIGCSNKKEAEAMGVRIGDPVMPCSAFSTMEKQVFASENGKGEGGTKAGDTTDTQNESKAVTLAMGKAFDDRIGAFVAAEVARRIKSEKIAHPNRFIGAATVQEEVGARGALTSGWIAEPDVVIALEVDISGDVPGIESHQAASVMGKGPSILAFDASMIPNQALKELVIETAEENAIPYQLSTMARGGTDAGQIHKLRAGCPGIVIGIPTRHIHSHVGILALDDVERCIQLLIKVVTTLDAETVAGLTAL